MAQTRTHSQCFTCSNQIPYSQRYPERLCEACMKKAVNQKGEQLSFHNESMSGGFISYNQSTKVSGKEHLCYVKGYECYADEAYMGGIVIVPTDRAREKKQNRQSQNKRTRKLVMIISAILAPIAIWGAYSISKDGYFNEGFTLFDVLIITGSISLLLFFGLSMYRYKIAVAIVAGLYAATGLYTTYHYGYRNDAFLEAVAIIGTACAALLLTYLVMSIDYVRRKTKDLQERKNKGSNAWVLLIIVPVFILIAAHIFLSIQGEDLAEQKIETDPSSTTTAIVKEVRQYNTRNRNGTSISHNEALLQYTVNGNTHYRILDNKISLYSTGSNLQIRYVVADPYLIKVLQTQ